MEQWTGRGNRASRRADRRAGPALARSAVAQVAKTRQRLPARDGAAATQVADRRQEDALHNRAARELVRSGRRERIRDAAEAATGRARICQRRACRAWPVVAVVQPSGGGECRRERRSACSRLAQEGAIAGRAKASKTAAST